MLMRLSHSKNRGLCIALLPILPICIIVSSFVPSQEGGIRKGLHADIALERESWGEIASRSCLGYIVRVLPLSMPDFRLKEEYSSLWEEAHLVA